MKKHSFTLIELLVVIAIIAILASLLLPSLSSARECSYQLACLNSLSQFGRANAMYTNDWNGCLADMSMYPGLSTFAAPYNWMWKIAPYLNRNDNKLKPCDDPKKLFTCPKNREGNFNGNFPSWSSTPYLSGDNWFGYPRKITQFQTPSAKFYLCEEKGYGVFFSWYFYTAVGDTPAIKLRHGGGKRANVLFLDSHAKSYGSPPLPLSSSDSQIGNWLSYNTAAPSGL